MKQLQMRGQLIVMALAAATAMTVAKPATALSNGPSPGAISGLVNSSLKSVSFIGGDHFVITPNLPSGNASAGHPFPFTVTAKTSGGSTDTSYNGTVDFSDTDGGATLPPPSPLVNGTGSFNATDLNLGRETLTATDSVTPSITGSVLYNVVGYSVGGAVPAVVQQGNVTSTTATVTPQRNYLGTITLSAPSLPSGWTAQFSPPSVTETGSNDTAASVTMLIRAPSNAPTGPTVLTFEGTSGTAVFTGTVTVTVKASSVPTSIVVTPTNPTVSPSATQQFSATAYDQNGVALSPQPSFTWSKAGDGTISASGLYTAGTASGSCTVTAMADRISGSTTVTVP